MMGFFEKKFFKKKLWIFVILFFLHCGEEKVKYAPQRPVSDEALIERTFFIDSFEIVFPFGVSYFPPGVSFEVRASFFCPDFPRSISAEGFLSADTELSGSDISLSVSPETFSCYGRTSISFRFGIPADVPPSRYFFFAIFRSSTGTRFLISDMINVKKGWEGYDIMLRNWRELPPAQIGNSPAQSFVKEGEKLRFFFVSDDLKLYTLTFSPDFLNTTTDYAENTTKETYEVESIKTPWSQPITLSAVSFEPESIIVVPGSRSFIFLRGITATEVIVASSDYKSAESFGIFPPFSPEVFIREKDTYYFTSEVCDFILKVDPALSTAEKISTPEFCKRLFALNGRFVMVGSRKIYVFPSSTTERLFDEFELDINVDYALGGEDGEITVYGFLSGTTELKAIKFSTKSFSTSATFSLPVTFQFRTYIPVSESRVLFFSGEDEMVRILDVENGKEVLERKVSGSKIKILSDGEESKSFVFYGRDRIDVFNFSADGKLRRFSGYFSGEPIGIITGEEKSVVFSEASGKIGIFEYDLGSGGISIYISSNRAEKWKIFAFDVDVFFVFFSDDAGCWENLECEGSEYVLLRLKEFSSEESFFRHISSSSQRFLGVYFLESIPFVFLKDRGKIRVFVR